MTYKDFVILSGCNPRYPSNSGCGTQPDPHGALAVWLTANGFDGRFIETAGRYGGQDEPGYLVEVHCLSDVVSLMDVAREFGQECILHVTSERHAHFVYVNGPKVGERGFYVVEPYSSGFAYGPSSVPPPGGDNFTVINAPCEGRLPVPLYFAFNIAEGL